MNNLDMMKKRLLWQGGVEQENRMIKDKFRTLQRTLLYSYQACTVAKVQPFDVCVDLLDEGMVFAEDFRALINPDKVKQDYDDKIISIPYECGFGPGDVFEWRKTNTQWIIYLEQITEDAYFRGEIRRCRHRINFKDKDGNPWSTYAAIRGPVETQIIPIQKNQIRLDQANLTLNILVPRNEKTLDMFKRYSEFIFDGKCWRVETVDSISMKNVIEMTAEEYYINREADDLENELKNGLVIEPIDPTPNSEIEGNVFIKPKIIEEYSIDRSGGEWKIKECGRPVKLVNPIGPAVQLIWEKTTSGSFTLVWSDGTETVEKAIVVESLF